jgi:LemA protein
MSSDTFLYTMLALAGLGIAVFTVGIYNRIQRLANLIPEAVSNVAVLVRKRSDLITKLVSIVESYGIHESSVTRGVSGDFGAGAASRNATVERLASLRMAFPDLKADRLYESLIVELANVESMIAERREQYNSAVRSYNTLLSQFPNNVLMRPFGFQREHFLSEQDLGFPPPP